MPARASSNKDGEEETQKTKSGKNAGPEGNDGGSSDYTVEKLREAAREFVKERPRDEQGRFLSDREAGLMSQEEMDNEDRALEAQRKRESYSEGDLSASLGTGMTGAAGPHI